MTLHVKQAGAWKPTKDLWTKQAGVWKPVRRAFVKQGGVWKQSFQDEVPGTITANTLNANAANYFSADDWANPLIVKRLVIAPPVTCWSATVGTPGLHAGYGRGGKLIIENYGYITGAGGAANSGEGGFAFYVDTPGVSLINHGQILGGGGGGGRGGNGGQGYYPTETRDPVTGEYFNENGTQKYMWNSHDSGIYWATGGAPKYVAALPYAAPDGYTYRLGSIRYNGWYGIYRTLAGANVITAGGAGGSGGRGYGFDANLVNVYGQGRGAGAAGGTNAGAGGYGGDGNTWGLQGGTGYAGAAGNSGGGLAGAAGGLGGHYIYGYSFLDQFTNYGTVLGRVA